jgi:hypothetical protein
MLVRRVCDHQLYHQLHPALVHGGEQRVEILERPEDRIDVLVVAVVVAVVVLRRGTDRRQPEDVDAEFGEVVEAREDAAEIPDSVAVRVGEAARIDLIRDG